MKYLIIATTLLLVACSQQAPTSFADRVASAETLEGTPAGLAYVTQIIKEHADSINSFAVDCYADSMLDKDTFQLVADVNPSGAITNVLVQPRTTQATCYAGKFSRLEVNANRPAGYANKSFPLVINVNYNR